VFDGCSYGIVTNVIPKQMTGSQVEIPGGEYFDYRTIKMEKTTPKNIDYFGILGSYCQVQSHLNTVLLFSLIGKNFLWVELHETRTC